MFGMYLQQIRSWSSLRLGIRLFVLASLTVVLQGCIEDAPLYRSDRPVFQESDEFPLEGEFKAVNDPPRVVINLDHSKGRRTYTLSNAKGEDPTSVDFLRITASLYIAELKYQHTNASNYVLVDVINQDQFDVYFTPSSEQDKIRSLASDHGVSLNLDRPYLLEGDEERLKAFFRSQWRQLFDKPAMGFAKVAAQSRESSRVALVIGNQQYEHMSRLNNPRGDAEAIASLLKGSGFDVSVINDANAEQMRDALADFSHSSKSADVAFFYYSGHGMEISGKNILAPIDMSENCNEQPVKRQVSLTEAIESTKLAKSRFLFIDACRNDPFPSCKTRGAGSLGFNKGLEPVAEGDNYLLLFSTDQGHPAADGNPGESSPFARALTDVLGSNPNKPIRNLAYDIAKSVMTTTNNRQVPEQASKGYVPEVCLSATDCQ